MKKILIAFFLCITTLMNSCDINLNSNISNSKEEHIHSYASKIVMPTCISQGYTFHVCNCGKNYKDQITNALGHNYIEKEQNYKCSRCERYEDEGFVFELVTSDMAKNDDSYKERINTYYVKNVTDKAIENGKVSLPRKHMGYQVSGIYKGALYYVKSKIKTLYIPNVIKYIGSNLVGYDGQFGTSNENVALEEILFDDKCSDMVVSHTAFQFCKKVSNISIPIGSIKYFNHDDIISNHFIFEDTAYYKNNRIEERGCYYIFGILTESNQKNVNSNFAIKDGTTIIANHAFMGNTNIKTIELPSSLKYIGKNAFAQCASLTTINYKSSESMFNKILIEENAFHDCKTIIYQFN